MLKVYQKSVDFGSATVFYHDDCLDGFSAAWVYARAYPNAVMVPSDPHPAIEGLSGDVVCLDCCFSESDIQLVLASSEVTSLTIMDHHLTNFRWLKNIDHPKLSTVLNLGKAGVGIVWDVLNPGIKLPIMFEFIQEMDLWNTDFLNVYEANSYISRLPRSFTAWSAAVTLFDSDCERIINDSKTMVEDDLNRISDYCSAAVPLTISGYGVVGAECPKRFVSQVALRLADGYPFGVAYVRREKFVEYSLRSEQDGVDVEQIANALGGGGHRHVAAFRSNSLLQNSS